MTEEQKYYVSEIMDTIRSDLSDAGVSVSSKTIRSRLADARPKGSWVRAPRWAKIFVAAVAEWYRYRIVACLVTSSSPVPLKTRRVGQRCTLNLSRAETSSRWCGVVVRRGRCQLRCRPRHLTMVQNYVVRRPKPSCS
ncbi:uncharacterized protein TNCV_71251 [Trichonephila clavipes]|nr:uncharacterized protein TNCV_71251 [Trichonephila clavipes]